MTTPTREQLKFLHHHNIPWSKVFDAVGMRQSEYTKVMSDLEMVVAIGVSPCRLANHTMRTRAGHCVQCKPANLAFLLRFDRPGEIYIAHSASTGFTKVGTANDAEARIQSLNVHGYGQATDWELDYHQRCEKAGYVELLIQTELVKFRGFASYVKNGYAVDCHELFTCSIETAIAAARKIFNLEN